MIVPAELANPDQLATAVTSVVSEGPAAGARAVDVRVWDGIDLRLLPDRGLDVGAAWFRGTPLAWISPDGRAGASAIPRASSTTGLGQRLGRRPRDDVRPLERRPASEGHGLHGTYTARPAADLHVERTTSEVTVTGTVERPTFHARPPDRHDARPRGSSGSTTAIVNESEWTARRAAPLPRQHRRAAVGRRRVPRDGRASRSSRATTLRRPVSRPGTSRRPAVADADERVFEHVGASLGAARRTRAVGIELTISSSLPRLWQWVAAREPAPMRSRSSPRTAPCSAARTTSREGRMPFLDPGEARTPWLTIAGETAPVGAARHSPGCHRGLQCLCGGPAPAGSASCGAGLSMK